MLEDDVAVIGADVSEVSTTLLDRLLAAGGELVTLVSGVEAGDLAARATAWVEEIPPHVDVVVSDGGQERYPLLMSVE
jgi:dihydroxyacetone kinase-like predicted kinase